MHKFMPQVQKIWLNTHAKIAEATYNVLIEQAKSQTLAAGFQPETFKVFEYATPPLAPSSPNRSRFIFMGAVFGIFVGRALALMTQHVNSTLHRSSLLFNVNADLALRSKNIKRLAKKSFSEVAAQLSKRQITVLDEADLQLANKDIIYVMNSGGQPTASKAARLLAAQSAQSGRNVVLCDTTGQTYQEIKAKGTKGSSDFSIHKVNKI